MLTGVFADFHQVGDGQISGSGVPGGPLAGPEDGNLPSAA
jgi:hypothetical protein